VALLFYLCGRWAAKADFISFADLASGAYAATGSFVVLALLYFELHAAAVALGWAIFGAALFELGMLRKSRHWRAQSYVVLGLAFLRIWTFNLGAAPRDLLSYTLPVAFVFYYVYVRLTLAARSDADDSFALDQQMQAAPILAYLGSATLVLFARDYFRTGPSLIAWAVLALLFIAVAWLARQDVFLHHSVILAFLLFLQAFAYEFFQRLAISAPWLHDRSWYVAAASAILFACQGFAFPLRARFAEEQDASETGIVASVSQFLRRPEQVYFFLPMILVTLLILREVSTGRVTIAWGIEGVAMFLFALLVGERSYRLAGLGLLLTCVAKILVLDVWRQQRSDRYITFIILGAALLLVSFLYTRYSETINRYL